jgi:putative transposase
VSRNYYSEIHLHFVWHTKTSLPLLTPQVEPFVHRYLRGRIINTEGAFVHAVGGTETDVHVAVTVAPTVLVSDLVGRLKGASAHEANRLFGRGGKVLEWQAGYGVVSFGTKALEWVVAYIQNQREHHARGTVHERLERAEAMEAAAAPVAEAEPREAP